MAFENVKKNVSGSLKIIVCGEIGPWGAWIDLPNGERKTFDSPEDMIEYMKVHGNEHYGREEVNCRP